ncbi:MAG: glycosyltransferase family 2 protein [Pseudomonadota bacterium]
MYNEEHVLPALFERLTATLEGLDGLDWEVLVVDDGSQDASWRLICGAHGRDPRWLGLKLSRNFGHQLALTAGLDHARGDVVAVMDADLQDPPELLPEMVAAWREGAVVVYGERRSRAGEGWFKLASSWAFYALIQRLSPEPTPRNVGDFYLLDRAVVAQICAMRERSRYLRGLVFWVGYSRRAVRYHRGQRQAGDGKFGLGRMLRFAADGMLVSSTMPLDLATWAGLTAAVLGIALGIARLVFGDGGGALASWAVPAVLVVGGAQLVSIGVLGLYLGRIFDEVRRRPLYLVEQAMGIEPQAGEP